MLAGDLDAILEVQAGAYPGFLLESADFFLNRLALAPAHCWVAQAATPRDRLLGYLVSYPWDAGLPPTLDAPLTTLPEPADHWFLHDCAVAPSAQGLGVGRALLRTAAGHATQAGLRRASPVSLGSAVGYWLRHGYAPVAGGGRDLAAKLEGYGPQASYMARAFPL
ncbi:GNAT family N-acetyltransferase [Achromobacter dolens]|uniref:GNAT family N-acetyltransferase n=1 Tax=Achromobacter dolens TaxID=1287738 RepID=UPI003B9D5701